MKDTYHSHSVATAIVPAVKSAAEEGPAVDLKGCDGALIVFNTGAIAGAGDFSFKLQESDTTTGGDFTDVAAADRIGTVPATLEASSTYRVAYIGSKRKRYIRVAITKAGGTSIAASAVVMRVRPDLQPVA